MKSRLITRLRYLIATLLLVLCNIHAIAQDNTGNNDDSLSICHARMLAGFAKQNVKAKKFVGKDTSDYSQMNVFITVKDGHLYLHSNFRPPEYKFATKLETAANVTDMEQLAAYLVDNDGLPKSISKFRKAFYEEMSFIVDQSVFSDPKYKNIDFGTAQNVKVLGTDRITRSTLLIRRENNEAERLIQVNPSLYAHSSTSDILTLTAQLEAQQFNQDNIALLPLVIDNFTNKLIREGVPAKNQVIFDLSTKESLRESLSKHRNRTIFALGHIEELKDFVVRDNNGKSIFSIPVTELENLARESDITLFSLGCKSAVAGTGPGSISIINTADVVENLVTAMNTSKTNLEFLATLAAKNYSFVVTDSMFKEKRHSILIDIYPKIGVALGAITVPAIGTILISTSLPSVPQVAVPDPPDEQNATEVSGLADAIMQMIQELEEEKKLKDSQKNKSKKRKRVSKKTSSKRI